MSIASVSHGLAFGISSTSSKDNVFYVDENTVLYPVGCNVVGRYHESEQTIQSVRRNSGDELPIENFYVACHS
jgi:hypothetical protein